MDSPRTIVRRALEFDGPSRVPRHTWVLPYAAVRYPLVVRRLAVEYPDDIQTVPASYRTPLDVTGDLYRQGPYTDAWGCRWSNPHDGMLGQLGEPRLTTWDDLDAFETPVGLLDLDTASITRWCQAHDTFLLAGTIVRPFERIGFLRGYAQGLIDLSLETPDYVELLRRIHAHYVDEVEAWCRLPIDGIYLMDDWGTQSGMLVNPELFRRYYQPLYREYAAVAAHYGKFVLMHVDGHIVPILDDLVATGIHALNCQTACMGLDRLGPSLAGRITCWGELDRVTLMSSGTPAAVAAAARAYRRTFDRHGGVIAQCEFGVGTAPENVLAFHETFD